MRTSKQIDLIKTRISDPYEVKDFVTNSEILHLINLFDVSAHDVNSPAVYKNTGPVTLDLKLFLLDPVVDAVINRLTGIIGPYEITAAFFFRTNYPHIIHNDDTFELPDSVYKAITIPLKSYGSDNIPKLCFFNQFYFHGPAKFFCGSDDIPTYYNKQIYDYSDVDGLVDSAVDKTTLVSYLTHLKPTWLTGLTLWGTLDWRPTSALIFDSVRLHCAGDFRKQNIESKLGISIFTRVI
jgi:hypothetical protein